MGRSTFDLIETNENTGFKDSLLEIRRINFFCPKWPHTVALIAAW